MSCNIFLIVIITSYIHFVGNIRMSLHSSTLSTCCNKTTVCSIKYFSCLAWLIGELCYDWLNMLYSFLNQARSGHRLARAEFIIIASVHECLYVYVCVCVHPRGSDIDPI